MQPNDFISWVNRRAQPDDLMFISAAVDMAARAHAGQTRLSGEPYISHPLAVAKTLLELGLDVDTVVAGILHDVPEDTAVTLEEIQAEFGPEVMRLVAGVTKLGQLKYRGLERYIENLRRMFVAMAEDVRVMIIKFADRLHNLSTLEALPEAKRQRIARETIELYAPIAHRLGMGEMRGQLEDLAFPYVLPSEFAWIKQLVGPRYELLKKEVAKMETIIGGQLAAAGITIVNLHGRRKHLYSLYQKVIRPEYDRDITKITDLVALRIILRTVADCYAVLGTIHQLWKPVPNRFKDYIAQPKPNGYRSLHTTVFGSHGSTVEIQIRTQEMHEQAEYGIAAHWHYAEAGKPLEAKEVTKRFDWIQNLAKWQHEYATEEEYLQALKVDALSRRIFCFTPNGDVIDLPDGATPIDFAYHVHSDLGNRCVGTRINGQMSALDTPLKSGDVIEILTDKNRKMPNPDWLDIVRTQSARQHIRQALRARPGTTNSTR